MFYFFNNESNFFENFKATIAGKIFKTFFLWLFLKKIKHFNKRIIYTIEEEKKSQKILCTINYDNKIKYITL